MNLIRYPTHVTIEVTTVCNIIPPCVMCGKHVDPNTGWLNNDASHFPKELIPRMADLLAQTEVLSLYGIGEPLTCPYLFDFKNYVSDNCQLQFTSNGWLLNAANIDKIISNRIGLIDISLDATTPENYRKIRHGDFDEVIEKIANLTAAKRERGSIFPSVVINMCLMRENIDDLPGLPVLAKKLGVNHCYAFHLNTGMSWKYGWFDYDQQHCSLDPDHHDEQVIEAFRVAQEIGGTFEFKGTAVYKRGFIPPKFAIDMPSTCTKPTPWPWIKLDTTCDLPWRQVIVYRNGTVTNCCWMTGNCGSLYEKSFEEIWHGAVQESIREHLVNKTYHANCLSNLICPPRGRP